MRGQALVRDVQPAYQLPSLLWAADCCVGSPHLPCLLGVGCGLSPPGSPLAGVPSQSKTTLAFFMVLVYGVYHLLRQLQHSTIG